MMWKKTTAFILAGTLGLSGTCFAAEGEYGDAWESVSDKLKAVDAQEAYTADLDISVSSEKYNYDTTCRLYKNGDAYAASVVLGGEDVGAFVADASGAYINVGGLVNAALSAFLPAGEDSEEGSSIADQIPAILSMVGISHDWLHIAQPFSEETLEQITSFATKVSETLAPAAYGLPLLVDGDTYTLDVSFADLAAVGKEALPIYRENLAEWLEDGAAILDGMDLRGIAEPYVDVVYDSLELDQSQKDYIYSVLEQINSEMLYSLAGGKDELVAALDEVLAAAEEQVDAEQIADEESRIREVITFNGDGSVVQETTITISQALLEKFSKAMEEGSEELAGELAEGEVVSSTVLGGLNLAELGTITVNTKETVTPGAPEIAGLDEADELTDVLGTALQLVKNLGILGGSDEGDDYSYYEEESQEPYGEDLADGTYRIEGYLVHYDESLLLLDKSFSSDWYVFLDLTGEEFSYDYMTVGFDGDMSAEAYEEYIPAIYSGEYYENLEITDTVTEEAAAGVPVSFKTISYGEDYCVVSLLYYFAYDGGLFSGECSLEDEAQVPAAQEAILGAFLEITAE